MKKTLHNADVFEVLEKWAPQHLAYEWDNVGLQIGSYTNIVTKVMITLDVLESVVDEAIDQNVELIIAHHPLLFKPMQQLDVNSSKGRIVQKLIQHNITVYAAHTNLDVANGGVNDMLCDALGIESRKALVDTYSEKLFKIAVYVPLSHMNEVRNALSDSGAGHIGNYSHCTFQTEGQGTFKPFEGTNPYIGSQDKLELVEEVRIETIVSQAKMSNAVNAMIKAHPYEEVAYDMFPLKNKGATYGIGRMGKLEQTMTLQQLTEHVKKTLNVPQVRVTGNLTDDIKIVAILGGSGEGYVQAAIQQGADAYITGDMTFHTAQDAWQMGLSVIDPGHHIEKVMKKGVKHYLAKQLQQQNIEVITSESNTEPFQFI